MHRPLMGEEATHHLEEEVVEAIVAGMLEVEGGTYQGYFEEC